MRANFTKMVSISFLLFVLGADALLACRIIDPRPIIPPEPGPRPGPVSTQPMRTKSHSADITVDGQMAKVTVEAVFHNPNSFQIEGTYFFPLPADVAVRDFSMWINGREMKGELLDAPKAKKIYEDIVRRMKDPALLEFVGMQMLKLRVFPIAAHGDVRIKVGYSHLVPKDSGMLNLFYPLASAKTADCNPIGQISIRVDLKSDSPLKNVYSPTYRIDRVMKSDRHAVVGFEGRDINPGRDFTLYWAEDKRDVGISLLTHAEDADKYFMLLLSPKVEFSEENTPAKDVVFAIDTSGSMQDGVKMEQAKRALKFCISKLRPQDGFNLISFSTGANKLFSKPMPATRENIDKALKAVDNMQAAGGTAIDEALREGMSQLAASENLPMLLFLTDGMPTIGETNTDAIVGNATVHNKRQARVFVFGVGYDVNTKLLDRISESGRGAREYVKPEENIEVKVSNLYSKVESPVLSDVTVTFDGIGASDVYPKKIPDIFRGSQQIVLGRFSGEGAHAIRVKGRVAGKEKEFVYEATWGSKKAQDYLPTLWAMRKAGYLLDEIRLHGSNSELVEEVTRLGKRYGIVTPYTSFLVVEDTAAAAPAITRREREERDRSIIGGMEKRAKDDFVAGKSGRGAVENSESVNDLKANQPPLAVQADNAGGPAASAFQRRIQSDGEMDKLRKNGQEIRQAAIRQIAGKTFVKRYGEWTDTALTEEQIKNAERIEFLGEKYFALTARNPELAKILSIGDHIVVLWEGRAYRVGGPESGGKGIE